MLGSMAPDKREKEPYRFSEMLKGPFLARRQTFLFDPHIPNPQKRYIA